MQPIDQDKNGRCTVLIRLHALVCDVGQFGQDLGDLTHADLFTGLRQAADHTLQGIVQLTVLGRAVQDDEARTLLGQLRAETDQADAQHVCHQIVSLSDDQAIGTALALECHAHRGLDRDG